LETITYINGERSEQIDISDRGCMYGDGVFETMLACNATVPFWQRHIQRLKRGCERLIIPVPLEQEIWNRIEPHLATARFRVIKIIVTRGSGRRGYRVTSTVRPNTIVTISERQIKPATYWHDGVSVHRCKTTLAEQPALAGIKHLNRLEQVLASQEWDDACQEGMMCNAQGNVIEATYHNVFAVKDGTLFTPDLTNAGVEGVMREYVIELAGNRGMPMYIKPIPYDEFAGMDEVFLTNSVDGIWPVCKLGEWVFACGEITRKFQDEVTRVLPFQ